MATFPARPGTGLSTDSNGITGAVITSDSSAGGADAFYLKVTSATFSGTVPVVETTGSGDNHVRYEHGDKPYYDIQLQGVMLGDKGVQLQNLTNQFTSAGVPQVTVDFRFSGAGGSIHNFTGMRVIVTQCQIQFDPKLPVVGVAMALKSMAPADQGLEGGAVSYS
tara:strand:+ start:155 stop:649 length:495 start_codon:yes stop_codon:yes gene_type:complete